MQIKLDGITLDIDFKYYRARRGLRDSLGVPLTPDEGEELEIETVWLDDVDITSLVGSRMEEIENLVMEGVREDRRAA